MTSDRKGNKPVKLLLVEIAEALKAPHCVDPASDMQFCAMAVGMLLASNVATTLGTLLKCEVFRRFDRRAGSEGAAGIMSQRWSEVRRVLASSSCPSSCPLDLRSTNELRMLSLSHLAACPSTTVPCMLRFGLPLSSGTCNVFFQHRPYVHQTIGWNVSGFSLPTLPIAKLHKTRRPVFT